MASTSSTGAARLTVWCDLPCHARRHVDGIELDDERADAFTDPRPGEQRRR